MVWFSANKIFKVKPWNGFKLFFSPLFTPLNIEPLNAMGADTSILKRAYL